MRRREKRDLKSSSSSSSVVVVVVVVVVVIGHGHVGDDSWYCDIVLLQGGTDIPDSVTLITATRC